MLQKIGSIIGLALGVLLLGILLAFLFFQIPPVKAHYGWRLDAALTYLQSRVDPAGDMPTPIPTEIQPTVESTATSTATVQPTVTTTLNIPTATSTATPLPTVTLAPAPDKFELDAPYYEEQDWNNCGPATLSMQMHYFGWDGKQEDISEVIKPVKGDRNVNIDEMTYYVSTYVGWLGAEYRVGGDIPLLENLISAGVPVMVEVSFILPESDPGLRYDDDRWTGHYLLVTGYDRTRGLFTVQNAWGGPGLKVSYQDFENSWVAFNHVYMVLFRDDQKEIVRQILGENWDVDKNRELALAASEQAVQVDEKNGYTWFNLGTNLVYFQRYSEAVKAYDQARTLKLPQRMLRYQFGPFIAYFRTNRLEELMTLVDYALKITDNSQEALLWQGWGLYRQGKKQEAVASFLKALEENPGYGDAKYALDFVTNN